MSLFKTESYSIHEKAINLTLHHAKKGLNSRKTRHRQGCLGEEGVIFHSEMPEKILLGKNKASTIGLHNRRHKTHYTRRKFCWSSININKGHCAYKNSSTLCNDNAALQESAGHKFGITVIFTFGIAYNI